MRAEDWLKKATKTLETTGSGTARIDALVLLEDACNKDRSYLLAHPEFEISEGAAKQLKGWLNRRAQHEPLAYIREKTEFYGREFIINHDVLEPRPESETMIGLLKKTARTIRLEAGNGLTIIDVGTGSGALAITAQLELSDMNNVDVMAIDIDEKCLEIAKKNAAKHTVKIKCIKSDLLSGLPALSRRPTAVILANLPYVPDTHTINQAAMHEPKIAIFGGPDGLDLYRHMFEQLKSMDERPVHIFTESLPPQHAKLANIAQKSGYKLVETDDFIQHFRVA